TGKSENVERALFSPVLDGVAQDTDPLDIHFEDIARLHENRWLARRPDATGCSGDDHITRLETRRDADQFDQRRDVEDEQIGMPHPASLGRSSGPECATRWPPAARHRASPARVRMPLWHRNSCPSSIAACAVENRESSH